MNENVIELGNYRGKAPSLYSAAKPYSGPPLDTATTTATEDDPPLDTGATIAEGPPAQLETTLPTQTYAYVKVRSDFFQEMLDTLIYYGAQHFDHGERAKELLDRRSDN